MNTRVLSSHLAMRVLGVLAFAAVMLPAATAHAQDATTSASVGSIEFRPFLGAIVPTGDQKDVFKSSPIMGLELGWQFQQHFAITGSGGWSPAARQVDDKLDIYQYDLALEGRMNNLVSGSAWTLRPYARLGAGGRAYNYRGPTTNKDTQTGFVGHGALGIDFGRKASDIGFRIEARDNVSQFKGLLGELPDRTSRNDMQFTAGLTLHM